MQISTLGGRYPQVAHIHEYVEFYPSSSLTLDGSFSAADLRIIADFNDAVSKDFYEWYAQVRMLDDDLTTDPVNAFWHDFCNGLTPEKSLERSGQYGRK